MGAVEGESRAPAFVGEYKAIGGQSGCLLFCIMID